MLFHGEKHFKRYLCLRFFYAVGVSSRLTSGRTVKGGLLDVIDGIEVLDGLDILDVLEVLDSIEAIDTIEKR